MRNNDGNLIFESMPHIASFASVVGKKEGEGPLRDYFDRIIHDSYAGKDTFEQAESELMSTAVRVALNKGDFTQEQIDLACCGDLLNQCVASSFAMRTYAIPYAGVYGACSTMALSMILSAIAIDSGAAKRAVCAASSHYCTAERQYRFPLEYGSQRPPTAQWTVTGSGACILEKAGNKDNPKNHHADHRSSWRSSLGNDSRTKEDKNMPRTPYLHSARLGRIIDFQITDQNNMGAAMAPAICIIRPYPNAQKRRLHLCFHDYITKKEVFVTNCGGDHKVDFSGKSYLNRRRRMSKKISAKNKRYYIQKDDYELPELTLPALEAIYGVWGTRYRHYLMRHDKVKYYTLLCSCVLHEHITEIDLRADRFFEETVNRLKKQKSVTEKLRINNPELWKKMMNKITDEATETVYREVIFKEE